MVSIHSRLFKPGEFDFSRAKAAQGWFQSTPDYLNRENLVWLAFTTQYSAFQSTPDYLNRENNEYQVNIKGMQMFQSTPDYLNRENRCNL